MGALMHQLHADQQRLEERAEAIPGLQVTHFDAPAKSPRAELLMATNAEQRTQIEALQERNAVLARRVADLSQELRDLKGDSARAQPGCHLAVTYCGDARVLVEFDYQAAEDGSTDLESPRFGPDTPEEIEPLRAFVNGHWIDLYDLNAGLSEDRLQEACREAISEAREAAAAARAEAYAED